MSIEKLLVELVAGDGHFPGVEDDDTIAHVEVRRIAGFVFAAQQRGNSGRQTSQVHPGGVDHVPRSLNGFDRWRIAGISHLTFSVPKDTSISVRPCGGAIARARLRSAAWNAPVNSASVRLPRPMSTISPTSVRTMRCKKPLASIR